PLFILSAHTHRLLHSFPTRRSSDLPRTAPRVSACTARGVRKSRPPAAATRLGRVDHRHLGLQRRAGRVCVPPRRHLGGRPRRVEDRKSTRLNSSHRTISYAVFCLKK